MADGSRRRLSGSKRTEMGKSVKEKKLKKPKERWLLTRKTWRYMTDAGRKLIPDGALNRPEDVPKIEAYFQEVCQKEPKFLLWRKSSYPGALSFRSHRSRRNRKGGSCRTKSSSADECDEVGRKPSQYYEAQHISGGRFDIQKLKRDFLNKPPPSAQLYGSGGPRSSLKQLNLPTTVEETTETNQLADMLGNYLKIQGSNQSVERIDDKGGTFDYQALVDRLQQHLNSIYQSTKSQSRIPSLPSRIPPQTSTIPSLPSTSIKRSPSGGNVQQILSDPVHRSLSQTLSRYFSRSTNRQQVISNLLTDRKLLESLYFELRQTKGFRNTRATGANTGGYNSNLGSQWRPLHYYEYNIDDEEYDSYEEDEKGSWKTLGKSKTKNTIEKSQSYPSFSPPRIAIHQETITYSDFGIQTDPLSEIVLQELENEYKNKQNDKNEETKKLPGKHGTLRRKSSVDHDDVSQSVSDTIKRYLRMARKKSVDTDKVDRFKRVNYDKNLRFIKAKGEITKPGDDDGLNKGSQTNDDWLLTYRDLKFDDIPSSEVASPTYAEFYIFGGEASRMTSSRSSFETNPGDDPPLLPEHINTGSPKSSPSSPPSPSGLIASGQSFLSHLLHGSKHSDKNHSSQQNPSQSPAAGAGVAMQKSKSSSSVGSRLVAKKLWRSRSKSQTRVPTNTACSWVPQGQCTWTNLTGRQVTLQDTTLLQLTEVERRVLQKMALAKLQALNLGVSIKIPSETSSVAVTKPKRKAYLLKRKALTTSFFDNTRGDKEKGSTTSGSSTNTQSSGGLVFGIPLNQCIENDRLARLARGGSPLRGSRLELSSGGDATSGTDLRRQSHHGSRASFSSLIDAARNEDGGSTESLMSRERIGTSIPGLLDTISSSTSDLAVTSSEDEPGVPHMVTACLRYLETHGLHTLGIFRVSSSKKRVRQLREDFDSGKEVSIGDDQCPHDVATLLKEYLRDLPDPLLCRDLYHAFVQTQKIRNRRQQFEALQHLVQLLPVANRDTLWSLLNFLAHVAHNADDQRNASGEWIAGNRMDSINLATVFAPNILHCIKPNSTGKESNERAEDRMDVINVIRSMIDYNKKLFIVSAELLDEIYTAMMESHPEVLDQLLSKKESTMIGDGAGDEIIESETQRTPSAPGALEHISDHTRLLSGDSESYTLNQRKIWSREEFLHGSAGMGGPDVAIRVRHKDREERSRDRLSKRRLRDDSMHRGQLAIADDNANYEITKSRSSSLDSANIHSETVTDSTRVLRITEEQRYSTTISESRRQSTPLLDNANVITASLKIPLQPAGSTPLSLNTDDPDIPYIEENSYTIMSDGKQQMPIGILRNVPNAPPRRRHRSMSGSDSSQGSVQPITGTISIGAQQQGYDSAMGSSATFSSPPRNTPSSVSSSIAGDGVFSSPPSWASTPPTSPDSSHTTVNYIPDESQHAVYSRMTVPIKQMTPAKSSDTTSTVILQKVTFTSAQELHQKPKQVEVYTQKKEMTASQGTEVTKSASTPIFTTKETKTSEQKFSPSISNIGGAVLRSRTADFERMMSKKTETIPIKTKESTTTAVSSADKKKYVKRRYTDSRHQTKHIPDAETLLKATTTSSSEKTETDKSSTRQQVQAQVYKRREIIASVPKEKRSIF